MDFKLKLFLFLTIIVNCNGHFNKLKTTYNKIMDRLHNFSIDLHIGHQTTPTPLPIYPQTITVVIKNPMDEGPHDNGYDGYNNSNQQNKGGNMNNNHQYQPGYNGTNQNSPGHSNGNDEGNKANQIDQKYNSQDTPNPGNNKIQYRNPYYKQNKQNSPPSVQKDQIDIRFGNN
ncbi:unnamed protein product [Danaus chrysippus]|uniref:(African queen) hypothetical protein n=1 Tax=Danaus chrysippus TaxID=151541 RepID=A0A8J2QJY0_9NEOP|nr:unnamed protein product [Danaus chrysippus]